MTQNKSYDPLDRLIADHIEEARDLCLRRRPVYEGVHAFSMGFENRMGRLHPGNHNLRLTRVILIAILTALCAMTVQAGFSGSPWQYTIESGQWTELFSLFDSSPTDQQAGDLIFSYLPKGYTLTDCDYERSSYTYRFIHADETLPTQSNFVTSLYVHAHWVGDSPLSGSIHNEGLAQAESIHLDDGNALLLTNHTGTLELIFARNGFEITIYADHLEASELIAFAEGIDFK